MEREHKGWQIEVNSYRSEGDKWRPQYSVLDAYRRKCSGRESCGAGPSTLRYGARVR